MEAAAALAAAEFDAGLEIEVPAVPRPAPSEKYVDRRRRNRSDVDPREIKNAHLRAS